MTDVFKVKEKEEKKRNEHEDEIKTMALLEIGKSAYIRKYFQILIMGYNNSIISSSRPSVLESKKTELIEWHSKKDQIERMLVAARDEQKRK